MARLLARFADEASGAIVPAIDEFTILDGVDYSMPLAVRLPEKVTAEEFQEVRKAALKEASAAFHFQFDRPYQTAENLGMFPIADPLREWDYGGGYGWGSTRQEILRRCHLAWERNPLANTAVELTTRFSVGEGLTITYSNTDVEEIVEEFRCNPENAINEFEKSLANDLQVDGEVFIRFKEDEDGQTVIIPLKPWEVCWIEHERGMPRRVTSYHVIQNMDNGTPGDFEQVTEDVPADDIIHVAINRMSYELRGRPEIFRILPWLSAYKSWLENRARQNHWRDALLWDVTLEGATSGQVATKRAQYKQPPAPGSLAIHNEKEKWNPLTNKSSAGDVAEDGRQIKLMIAAGAQLPEYMLSDGANANLASATAQQLPSLRKFTDFQDILIWQLWVPIYKRVIQNAIDAQRLPEECDEQDEEGDTIKIPSKREKPQNGDTAAMPQRPYHKTKSIKTLEAFTLTGPELESSDPKTLADALSLALGQGWVSSETAAGRMGFDYRMEQKRIKREEDMAAQDRAQGRIPPGPTQMLPTVSSPMQFPELVPTAAPAGNGETPEEPKVFPRRPQIESYAVEFPVSEELDMANLSLMINPALSAEALAADVDRQIVALSESARAVVERRARQEQTQRLAESERARQLALIEQTLSIMRAFTDALQSGAAMRLSEQYETPTIVVNVPEQPTPIININMPEQPAPVVNITTPPVTVNLPPEKESDETLKIERNPDGTISQVRKVRK